MLYSFDKILSVKPAFSRASVVYFLPRVVLPTTSPFSLTRSVPLFSTANAGLPEATAAVNSMLSANAVAVGVPASLVAPATAPAASIRPTSVPARTLAPVSNTGPPGINEDRILAAGLDNAFCKLEGVSGITLVP